MQSPFDQYDREFLSFIDRGELRIPRDSKSGKVLGLHARSWRVLPERSVEWVPAAGTGTVISYTVFHRQYAENFPVPYAVVLAQLAEGPRLLARLVGAAPAVGMAVNVGFDTAGLVFRPSPPSP